MQPGIAITWFLFTAPAHDLCVPPVPGTGPSDICRMNEYFWQPSLLALAACRPWAASTLRVILLWSLGYNWLPLGMLHRLWNQLQRACLSCKFRGGMRFCLWGSWICVSSKWPRDSCGFLTVSPLNSQEHRASWHRRASTHKLARSPPKAVCKPVCSGGPEG